MQYCIFVLSLLLILYGHLDPTDSGKNPLTDIKVHSAR